MKSSVQIKILNALAGGFATSTEIAEATRLTRNAVSVNLLRLERRGHVRRMGALSCSQPGPTNIAWELIFERLARSLEDRGRLASAKSVREYARR